MSAEEIIPYFEIAAYIIGIFIGIDYLYKEYCLKELKQTLTKHIEENIQNSVRRTFRKNNLNSIDEHSHLIRIDHEDEILKHGGDSNMSLYSCSSCSPTKNINSIT